MIALDDLSTGSKSNLEGLDRVELAIGDILASETLDALFDGAATVVHLAARPSVPRSLADPMASHLVNATGTVNVLEAARRCGVGHVIVASSSSDYGAAPELPKRESLKPSPKSPYAASKLAAESYALAWQESFGLSTLALRFFNVFGPLQPSGHAYAAVIPVFVAAALAGRPLPVHGDGHQTRDFTYVGTVVDALVDAVLRRVSHRGPVNLAFGSRVSLQELITELETLFGRSLEREHQPRRQGDVDDSQADSALLRSLFPEIVPVPLRRGLADTIAWSKTQAPD